MPGKFLYKQECYDIIGCCMEVHSILGPGLLEAVYQEALSIELRNQEIPFMKEKELEVTYKDQVLNKKYIADFVCFDEIIIELKAVKELNEVHMAQTLNYLKITDKRLGLLVNFGSDRLEYKRIINS